MRLTQLHIESKNWFSSTMNYTIGRACNAES